MPMLSDLHIEQGRLVDFLGNLFTMDEWAVTELQVKVCFEMKTLNLKISYEGDLLQPGSE